MATSDNCVRILSAYSGKTVHVLSCKPAPAYGLSATPREPAVARSTSICCLGWGVNLTDCRGAARTAKESQGRLTVEDMLSPETPLSKLPYMKADLPRELALLDIDRSLPKLSTLPSTGDEYVVNCLASQVEDGFVSRDRANSPLVMIYSVLACQSTRSFIPTIVKTLTQLT